MLLIIIDKMDKMRIQPIVFDKVSKIYYRISVEMWRNIFLKGSE